MQLSDKAHEFRGWVQASENFLESCDGGDVGSPDSPSVWLLGVEPGKSLGDQRREASGVVAASNERQQYGVHLQLGWPFNRNAFKLLCALEGQEPAGYRLFAERARPFERGCKGYFKGNLFPVPLHKLNAWDQAAIRDTGFETKRDYQAWLRSVRFPIVSSWIEKCRPKLVIGVGLTHRDDFLEIVKVKLSGAKRCTFAVNGYEKSLYLSRLGIAPIVILPHLTGGSNGLNSNEAIAQAAMVIKSELT